MCIQKEQLNVTNNSETEGLNEKDLLCIALHIAEYADICLKGDGQADPACGKCVYAGSGSCTELPLVMDPWPAFIKLGKVTGVDITPFCNKKQLEIAKKQQEAGISKPLSDDLAKLWFTKK